MLGKLVRPGPALTGGAARDRLRGASAIGAMMLVALAVAVAVAVGVGITPAPVQLPPAATTVTPACAAPRWVSGWQTATQPAAGDPALTGATLRMIVHPQVTGAQVRVRLSNTYGTAPLAVGSVSAARSDGAAGLVPGSMRAVTFDGRAEVTIPAGGSAVSDPAPLIAQAGQPIAVSFHLPAAPAVITQHPLALQTSYLSHAGDVALDDSGAGFEPVRSWLVLSGLDVLAPRPENAVVAVGDSITDGFGSPFDADERWSDALAARLTGAGGTSRMAVLNAGISGNRLLAADPATVGDSPLTRFARDVLEPPGITDVVLHIGTNDIAAGQGASQIIAAMQAYAQLAHESGRRIFLTTVTPSDPATHGGSSALATRTAVNGWVLGAGRQHADGVFDFAGAVADPAQPSRLAPDLDSGDGLHLSPAGYRALAAAVDVSRLTGSPCLADTSPVRVLLAGS